MDEDEGKALSWLLGRGNKTETVRPVDGRKFEAHIGDDDGRAALARVLRRNEPLHQSIRNAMANALERVGGSTMRFELCLTRRAGRGRPPKKVKLAIDLVRRAKIVENHEETEKGYIAVETAADDAGVSKSTMQRAKRNARRLREINKS